MKTTLIVAAVLCSAPAIVSAQSTRLDIPDWAWPGSPTHKQVPPPQDFHRPGRNFAVPIGVFEGQSDIGGPALPGSAGYDAEKKQYTITGAGYNVWYTRDEFRFLWKKMSGDISLAANVSFPDEKGYADRKVVLVIRQDLDDDAAEVMLGEHAGGLVHLAHRAEKGATMKDLQYRFGGTLAKTLPQRVGIEKRGDSIAIFISIAGEPMNQLGPPVKLHFEGPVYVGIGFCSHVPDKADTAVVSNLLLQNEAGKVR